MTLSVAIELSEETSEGGSYCEHSMLTLYSQDSSDFSAMCEIQREDKKITSKRYCTLTGNPVKNCRLLLYYYTRRIGNMVYIVLSSHRREDNLY